MPTMESDQAYSAPIALDQVVTREAAPAALEQLRADRASGRMTQGDYFTRLDYLHAVIDSDPTHAAPNPPKGVETMEERFERDYAEHMAAPDDGAGYGSLIVPRVESFSDDDNSAFDAGVRSVFVRGGIPQHLATPLVEQLAKTIEGVAGSDETTRQAQLATSGAKLREMWGDEYDARLDRVNALLADMVEGDAYVREVADSVPGLFHANPVVMDYLDRVASHRSRTVKK
jgi:hypothetical protein